MKIKLGLAALVLLWGSTSIADEAPPHLFDDLNADGASDARISDADAANNSPSREVDDADQTPYEPPAEEAPVEDGQPQSDPER